MFPCPSVQPLPRPLRAKQRIAAVTTSWLFICFRTRGEEVGGQRAKYRFPFLFYTIKYVRYITYKTDIDPSLFHKLFKNWVEDIVYIIQWSWNCQPFIERAVLYIYMLQPFLSLMRQVALMTDWAKVGRSCWQANTVASGPKGKYQMCPIYHRDRWEVGDTDRSCVSLSSYFLCLYVSLRRTKNNSWPVWTTDNTRDAPSTK